MSLSSTEAEFFAAMVAARDAVWLRDVLSDLGVELGGPTSIRSDNKSVIDLAMDAIAFKKTKHIMRAAFYLRDLQDRRFVFLSWVSGKTNPADLFTKAVDLATFRALMAVLDRLDGIA